MSPETSLRPSAARAPVLVLDADQASALAIVRSLARQGLTVRVAASGDGAIAARSRHVTEALRYPDPLREAAAFVDWVAERQRSQPQELVIPVTERTVVPLMRAHARLPDAARLAIAPPAALEQVLDKSRTVALARELDVPVPHSWPVEALDALDAFLAMMDGPQGWGWPVVVKPTRSVGQGGGQAVQLSVSYAHDATGLRQQVQHALRYGQVMLQEYFRGDGVGIELIARHGEIRHAFQHRRLHEVPLTGGGSSLRVSDPIVPALLEASRRLVRALGWHGVAMVEFKHEPRSGAFRLMEINGRFWGSLPLAIAAGADFPAMLHELMTTGEVRERPPARTGVLCRHLARDLDWVEHVLRKAAPPQLVRLPSHGQVLRDSLSVLSPRHHFDVQSWRDPWPGLVDAGRLVRHQWRRVSEQLQQRRALRRAWQDARARQRSVAAAGAPQRVLFLCYGNINRSALAQAHADARGLAAGWRTDSAGFHTPAGRPADPVMVETAAAAGVDLGAWRSHTLSREQVERADLILAMELTHLDRLAREHPQARGKAFLLGAPLADEAGRAEIPDPYGQPRATYQRVCDQVRHAVDAWLGLRPTP